ncbi:ABC transporter substrate-binding protein [Mesorhizobium australafricanum]|uniref:ABC transporter substrate-binding protein n=1 Tax=Mesorhizobium australafricanum TaxID=3072311 RepID=A0ABU4WW11_9HYPH|nr:ABC transporter substrate-binding protein [Mesorhizobium sp. VK3E]MDX8440249.1 ABC transporter substrate-binding protein [Mesorhizobium sp. VK3E]
MTIDTTISPPAPAALRLAGGAQGFNWLPVFVADELGLFAKHGIAIEYKRFGSVDKATSAVLEDEADLAITPPEGAVADFVKGGELRIVAANAVRLPMSLVARPEIHSLADLKGKKIGTSSLTEGTAIYTQIVLASEGLRYPGDYEFVLAGIHTKRWEALQAGEIDCAPQPAPWNFLAEDQGYNLIGEINAFIPEILFTAVMGRSSWLQANRDMVIRFIKALIEGHAITNSPARQDLTLPIFQRITTPESSTLANRGLEYMRDMGMWPDKLAVPENALGTTIDLMIRAHLLEEALRSQALHAFDASYLDAAWV